MKNLNKFLEIIIFLIIIIFSFSSCVQLAAALISDAVNISSYNKQTNERSNTGTSDLIFTLINSDTAYSASLFSTTGSSVIIPEIHNGKPVTSIGRASHNFSDTLIDNIRIPNSIISINERAFTIRIPATVIIGANVNINEGAFLYLETNREIKDSGFTRYYNRNGRKSGTYSFKVITGWSYIQ